MSKKIFVRLMSTDLLQEIPPDQYLEIHPNESCTSYGFLDVSTLVSVSHVAKPKEGHYIVDFQDGAQLELIFKDPFGDERGNIAYYDYAIAAQGQQSIAGWNKNGCGCEPDFRDEVSSYLQRDDYEDDQLIDFMKTTSYIAISVVQVPITINWIVDTHDWFFLTVGYDSVEFRSFCDGFNSSLS